MEEILIGGKLKSIATGNIVADTDGIYDTYLKQNQETINATFDRKITELDNKYKYYTEGNNSSKYTYHYETSTVYKDTTITFSLDRISINSYLEESQNYISNSLIIYSGGIEVKSLGSNAQGSTLIISPTQVSLNNKKILTQGDLDDLTKEYDKVKSIVEELKEACYATAVKYTDVVGSTGITIAIQTVDIPHQITLKQKYNYFKCQQSNKAVPTYNRWFPGAIHGIGEEPILYFGNPYLGWKAAYYVFNHCTSLNEVPEPPDTYRDDGTEYGIIFSFNDFILYYNPDFMEQGSVANKITIADRKLFNEMPLEKIDVTLGIPYSES